MVGNIATILLLDSISKKFIKTNTTELGLMGITIVNSFDEITDDMLSNNKNLIILESYFQNNASYSDVRLFKSLFGSLRFVFLGVNQEFLDTLKE